MIIAALGYTVDPGGHLYSKVDIILKNTEKGWFFKERHVPHGPCLGCQKQQKSRKRVWFFRLIKIRDKGLFFSYYKHRIRV